MFAHLLGSLAVILLTVTVSPTVLHAQTCGDGAVESPEACDDGNSNSWDGCSSSCNVESGYYCGTPGSPCCPDEDGNNTCDTCGDSFIATSHPTWTARESNRDWLSITSSSDGTKQAAVVGGGQIYTSTDSGVTWTARESNRSWTSITTSSDGTKLAAVVYGGRIYTSTDSGVTWTARGGVNRNWLSITSSSDGTKLAAFVLGGQIYTSTDSGVSWTARESNRNWLSITSSSDGTKLAAVVTSGQIYTSTDSGVTWTARESNRGWNSITSSSDGTKLAAVVNNGQIYTSTDSGVTWTAREVNRNWRSITSSSDGTKLAAVAYPGQVYTSTDSGITWTARESNRNWYSITSSSDGTKLAAVVNGGQIYTSAFEQCDDGNSTPGDGCSDTCSVETGYHCPTAGLACCVDSDGNTGCDCGDGTLDADESCDDGNPNSGDGCSNTCSVEAPYLCPSVGSACCLDSNSNGACDGTEPYCGDGSCDSGYGEDCHTCSGDCGGCEPYCGDGSCDSGYGEDCNTCSGDCGECRPFCGDGFCGYGEDCDTCSSDCGGCGPYCGNGSIEYGEACDDGNSTSSDGCSSSCNVESGYNCGTPGSPCCPDEDSNNTCDTCGDGFIATSHPTWTARESNRNWVSITSSSDGTKLAAVESYGQIYTSTDSGITWTARESNRYWYSITSSSDGTKLAAVARNGQIHTSTDSGASWTARESNRDWRSITSSSDGTKLAAIDYGGQIHTSTDSGVTWTARESNRYWYSITSSSDGTKLAAVDFYGWIYTSTDSGVSWTARESNRNWISITSSSDGTKLAAVEYGGQIYTSTDSGVTWTARESNRYWYSITSSSDGTKLAAVVNNGQIYTSTDSGVSWTARESNRSWISITSSSDGTKLAAVDNGGQIYTSATEQCDDGNSTPGDGCSDSCQTESGYSCSGAPSVCVPLATATDTPTATITPTPTGTATFTPTATPTPQSTATPRRVPPPPVLSQRGMSAGSQVLSSGTFLLGGAARARHLIEISVDDVVVGRARVNSRSLWKFNLPPLAIGQRSITAVTIDAKGQRSQPSAPVILTVLSSAPLDFVGAGDTAVTVSRTAGDLIRYKTRRRSSERWTLHEIPGHYAVPGDYDGDGVSDIAAVEERSGKLIWNIRSSITGGRSSVELGSEGDVIVSGCKLLSAERVSAVTFHRPTRHIRAQEIGAHGKKLSVDLPVGKGDLLGCGDTDGDGIDEIIFKVPGSEGADAIAAFTGKGHRAVFTDMSKFARALVVRRSATEVPLVALVQGESRKGIPVRVESLAGSFSFPMFYIDKDSTISTGFFTDTKGEQSAGLLWAQNDTRTVFRRLLKPRAQAERLFKLPHGYTLTRTQNIYRTR